MDYHQRVTIAIALAAFFLAAASPSHGQDSLVASWNFNDDTNEPDSLLAVSHGSGVMTTNWPEADIDNFAGSEVNLIDGDDAGGALALKHNANNGSFIEFEFSMTGKEDLVLSYATQRTASGFDSQAWAWKIEEEAPYSSLGQPIIPPASYELQEISFASVTEMTDEATVWIRAVFDGATHFSGNNRIDNVQFNATSIPEPSSFAALLGALAMAGVVALRRGGRALCGERRAGK